MELVGIDEDVKDQIYKLASSNLCSTVSGQIMTVSTAPWEQKRDLFFFWIFSDSSLSNNNSGYQQQSLMVRGPSPGDDSYESHEAEKKAILDSLKRRAKIVSTGLNDIDGFSCQPAMGSMYCFPAVQMPKGALLAAQREGSTPDTIYSVSLLQKTGICVVPASGFGQKPGRYGFRTTFLPPEDEMARAVEKIREHYQEFCRDYST